MPHRNAGSRAVASSLKAAVPATSLWNYVAVPGGRSTWSPPEEVAAVQKPSAGSVLWAHRVTAGARVDRYGSVAVWPERRVLARLEGDSSCRFRTPSSSRSRLRRRRRSDVGRVPADPLCGPGGAGGGPAPVLWVVRLALAGTWHAPPHRVDAEVLRWKVKLCRLQFCDEVSESCNVRKPLEGGGTLDVCFDHVKRRLH